MIPMIPNSPKKPPKEPPRIAPRLLFDPLLVWELGDNEVTATEVGTNTVDGDGVLTMITSETLTEPSDSVLEDCMVTDVGGGVEVEMTEEDEKVVLGGVVTGEVLEHVTAKRVDTGVVMTKVEVIGIGTVTVLVSPKQVLDCVNIGR